MLYCTVRILYFYIQYFDPRRLDSLAINSSTENGAQICVESNCHGWPSTLCRHCSCQRVFDLESETKRNIISEYLEYIQINSKTFFYN